MQGEGRLDWRERGSCYGSFNPVFFPDRYQGRQAQKICHGCEVQQECLDYAIDTRQTQGVWGGKTASQRLKIRYAKTPTEQESG